MKSNARNLSEVVETAEPVCIRQYRQRWFLGESTCNREFLAG
jgi:hypothetical protein